MRLRYLLCALCAAFSLNASAAIPASEQAVAVEFYHATLDHYFITADAKEINDLDTGVHKGWTRTGYRFAVMKGGSSYAGTSPVCRFYSPSMDTHFYSAKKGECDAVKEQFGSVWTFESDEVFRAFEVDPATGVCSTDTTGTFRLYNNRPDANHRYTDQVSVFHFMKLIKSFIPEGDGSPALPIAFCTPAGGDVVPVANESAPSCTVTANSSTPAVGASLNLDAACTNNPTTYMWIGCTSTSSSCTATKATAGSASYTLLAANASGPADPVTLTVNWGGGGGGGGGGAVPICTMTATSLQPVVNSSVTLTASCNNSPATYEWMLCSATIGNPSDPTAPPPCNINPNCAATSPTCAVSQTAAGPARYAVDAKNASGTGPKAYIDLAWAGAGGGGGGPISQVPVCSVSSTSTTPSTGTTITLTATCSGAPSSYDWIGSGIIGTCTGSTCQATWPTAQTVTYGVSGINGNGTGGRAYVGVNWTQTAPQVPACTLSTPKPTPQVGQTITISSSCTNSPLSYTWTGCSSTTGSCQDAATAAGLKSYQLVATNAAGNSPQASITVNWQPVPTDPPTCTVATSDANPFTGSNITLTATCTNSPTSYTWTGCSSTSKTCTTTQTTPGVATYGVTATNQIGTSPLVTVQATWQQSTGGQNFCGPNTAYVDITWGVPGPRNGRWLTTDYGGFPQGKIFVFKLTVPVGTPHSGSGQVFAPAEYQGPPAPRSMTLSENQCDFSTYLEGVSGTAPLIMFNVGGPPGNSLTPGKTYYFSLRNDNCGQASCDMSVSIPWR
jgi:hypothetical protein